MRKDWLVIALASTMLAACTTTYQPVSAPPQPAYHGPVVEIPGAEPRYEAFNPGTNQDYDVNGTRYKIITNPENFSQIGLSSSYGEEARGHLTATGENFDPNALSAAHPTLPLPSYVRVTNTANGRMIVVRVNDRGPYVPGRIIDLSQAAADRLNISNNTQVRLDYIAVAPDGSLSGPGTVGTTVAKQSYALPPRPDIGGGMSMATPVMTGENMFSPSAPQQPAEQNIRPIDNGTLQSNGVPGAPVQSSGFLGAPQPLRNGVLEGSEPVVSSTGTSESSSTPAAVASAMATSTTMPHSAASNGNYVVQAGALRDGTRAQQLADTLSQRFGVQGNVENSGNIYRVQLGRFHSRAEAIALQQRLINEANQSSFVTVAHDAM